MEELDAAGLLVTAKRPHPRTLVFEDLASLQYLSACIKARAWLACYVVHECSISDQVLGRY